MVAGNTSQNGSGGYPRAEREESAAKQQNDSRLLACF